MNPISFGIVAEVGWEILHKRKFVMWVLIVIVFLCLLFANTKSSNTARSADLEERPIEEDMEDFLVMDYLSDEEINGH